MDGHGDGRSRSRWWTVRNEVKRNETKRSETEVKRKWNGSETEVKRKWNETKPSGTIGHGTVKFSAKNEKFTKISHFC